MAGWTFTNKAAMYAAPETADTPFTRARRAWDERQGSVLRQKATWQRVAYLAVVGNVALVGAAMYLMFASIQVFPYVVEVSESGSVRTIGLLPQAHTTLTPATLQYTMQEWLPRVRNVITDPVAFGAQWQMAQRFMTARARQKIQPFLHEQILRHERGETVNIEVGTWMPVAGHAQSYQIEWIEDIYDIRGSRLERNEMVGIVHIDVVPPVRIVTDMEKFNPLGIYVRDFEFTLRNKVGGRS